MADDAEKKVKVKVPTPRKRDRQNETRRLQNQAFKSKAKTAWRSFEESLEKGEKESIQTALNSVYALMDKAAKRGIFKQNKADRLKSRAFARALSETS